MTPAIGGVSGFVWQSPVTSLPTWPLMRVGQCFGEIVVHAVVAAQQRDVADDVGA